MLTVFGAASSDLIATHFKLSIESVITILQFTLFLGPVLAYFVTKRICLALQKKDRQIVLHGYESGRIVRLPGGEYIEVHEPVDEYERWKLVSYNDYEPLMLRPNAAGRIPVSERARASISRWFFEDRLTPLTQTELDAALAHQHHELEHIATEEDAELQAAPSDGGTEVEIESFGLLPHAIGRGFGGHLLTRALTEAWRLHERWPALPPVSRVWLHTCTLDGPHARRNYERRGLVDYDTRTHEQDDVPAPGPWPGSHADTAASSRDQT